MKRASGAWALRGATFYRDEMLKLKHAAEARDKDALVRFLRADQRDIPKLPSHCEDGPKAPALAATRTANVDWLMIASSTSVRIILSCAHHLESIIMEVVLNVHALHLDCI